MSSLKGNRIVVASLFLPKGTVYYDDDQQPAQAPTVEITEEPSTIASAIVAPVSAALARLRSGSKGFSIVDDLTKAKGTPSSPAATPAGEKNNNPFSPFSSPRLGPQTGLSVRPLPSRLPTLNAATPAVKPRPAVQPPEANAPVAPKPPHTVVRKTSARRLSRSASRSSGLRRSSSVVRPSPRVGFFESPEYTPWQIEASSHGNTGLFNALNSVGDIVQKKLWVGIIDSPTDDFSEDLRVDLELKYHSQHDSVPVWITDAEFGGCYDVYCHQVLWPTLHYAVPDAPKTRANLYDSKSFEQYAAVNRKFADTIISSYQEGDIIMVNDYHLMLLPQMIREKIPSATIGFFLHVTFPSSEIFRCLAARQHLLRGMLGADLIAFQTHNHMRHFRQTVHRILSLEALPNGIQMENYFVHVEVLPMGIDLASLEAKRRDPEVADWVANLRQRYTGMKLIVGRDKLDEVQGVKQKVLAFEAFLEHNPDFRGKVVLIQVALSTTSENEAITSHTLSSTISRINSRFSTFAYTPVVLLHTSDLNFNQYLALLTVADAFLVTSLREGMALRTHEFIECQEERKRPLILSEFTGSYSFSGFRSCFVVNPYDANNTAQAIKAALTISDEEATTRWEDLHKHVITQTAQAFITTFLKRTKRAHEERTQRPFSSIPPFIASDNRQGYKDAKRRLFLLAIENTLVTQDPKLMRDSGFNMPEEVIRVLAKLSEDEKNSVYLLSGLPVQGALDKVADALPNVGLIAEEGCFVKPAPRSPGDKTEWISLVADVDVAWKHPCVEILNYFAERTPGSFIEERGASIRWRYWPGNADDTELPWARRQAAEAQNHIWDSLGEKFGLRIVPATRSFLVLPRTASRLKAVDLILDSSDSRLGTLQDGAFDYVLAIGNDEKLLGRINAIASSHTISTSMRNSDARWSMEKAKTTEALESLIGE
ncbi:hypothetical protein FRB94_005001 [Tulasnella sp. JGI-2019a]|nr:hypothetical protein FRB94_005001 [Tulasnella sp. JGI-2019a]KAG9037617.1 hypothetical protein FRB95_004837 [Tulasnella sp. JGI-2019a]